MQEHLREGRRNAGRGGTAVLERDLAPIELPSGRSRDWAGWEFAAVALLMVVAAGVRLYRLTALGLWEDEGFTAYWAPQSVPAILKWCINDYSPPLYYLLLHFWLPYCPDELGLRLPSVLFGVLAIPLIYLCGRSAHSPKAGLIAALLLIPNTFHVRYSQEARFYALYFALVLLAVYFTLELARGPSPGRWLGWVTAVTLMLYTHNTAPVYVLALTALAGVLPQVRRWRFWRGWLAAHAVVALLFLPWGATFLQQASRVIADYWPPTPTLTSLGITALQMFTVPLLNREGGPDDRPLAAMLLALPFLAFVIWALATRRGHRSGRNVLGLLAFGLGAWGLVFLISVTLRSVYILRIFLPVMGALLLSGAVVLAAADDAGRRAAARALTALMLLSGCLSLGLHYRHFRKSEIRNAVDYLVQHSRPGDAATVVQYKFGSVVYHYLTARRFPLFTTPLCDLLAGATNGSGPSPEQVAAMLKKPTTLWVIAVDDDTCRDFNKDVETWLSTFMRPIDVQTYHEVRLVRFERLE